jgi:tyrosinase
MAPIRRNILGTSVESVKARQQYVQGVKLLKQDFLGPTTGDFIPGLPGTSQQLSTYDLFVVWHHIAMSVLTPQLDDFLVLVPEGAVPRNAAHAGPVFLPWHRFMLSLLEQQLQRVLGDPNFGLPYWDWAADGELSAAGQTASALWNDDCLGGGGDLNDPRVPSGPFTTAENWSVRIAINVNSNLMVTDRPLLRFFMANIQAGTSVFGTTLPTKTHVGEALDEEDYDTSPWDTTAGGFRNVLEGWPGIGGSGLHNRVHVWIGGDMWPSTSPNDPVFYLNHCNVDRIWAAWMKKYGKVYLPNQTELDELRGHRIDDAMHALISPPLTPRQMLDLDGVHSYDTLDVAS